jgi:hypothetical protein
MSPRISCPDPGRDGIAFTDRREKAGLFEKKSMENIRRKGFIFFQKRKFAKRMGLPGFAERTKHESNQNTQGSEGLSSL